MEEYDDYYRNAVYYYDDADQRNGVYYYSDEDQRNAPPGFPPFMQPRRRVVDQRMLPPPPQTVVVAAPPPPPPPIQRRKMLGINASTGQLLNVGALVLAAFWPRPTAPQPTGEVPRDIAASIKYQSDLADHNQLTVRIQAIAAGAGLLLA